MGPPWPGSGCQAAGSGCFRCSCSLGPCPSWNWLQQHWMRKKTGNSIFCLGYKMLLMLNFMFRVAGKLLGCVSVALGAFVAHLG